MGAGDLDRGDGMTKATGRRPGHRAETHWPFAPLVAVLDPSTDEELALRFGVSTRCIHRWSAEGVPDTAADLLAIRCGLVAELVWPSFLRDRTGRIFDSLRAEMVAS